jgi:hypothetical protein
MVDERRVAGLHRATRALLGRERSESVLREAGSLTADYLSTRESLIGRARH